jgi:hypothetical protein
MTNKLETPRALSPVHEAVLQAWECAFLGTSITYLSGPITTGKRFFELVQSGEMTPSVRKRLIKENCDDLKAKALQLRVGRGQTVLEPASLTISDWAQNDYLVLWERLIEKHVNVVLFMPGWEFSVGCVTEFVKAITVGIRTETVTGVPLSLGSGLRLMSAAVKQIENAGALQDGALSEISAGIQRNIAIVSKLLEPELVLGETYLRKDEALDMLADKMNVAQFISFAPLKDKPVEQYSRISDELPNQQGRTILESVELLLRKSFDRSVNVRSYEPSSPQSREFIYGIKNAPEAVLAIERLSNEGLHTIINETIDVHDGGVSGVLMGDILEFSPDDTPRCVEKPGTASLPRYLGAELLSIVYGLKVDLDTPIDSRLEFSLHPQPCGWRNSRILAWEFSSQQSINSKSCISWPNNFSKLIGDKAYGLLVAHILDLPVPFTTVIGRRIAPFSFGRETGLTTNWIRTSPSVQEPGKYTTQQGWIDPFELLSAEDPQGTAISSVLCQRGVLQMYSGALIVGIDSQIIIEGKAGEGETFMLGTSTPEELPESVLRDVKALFARAKNSLGPIRFEWVHDGERAWIVQLHVGATRSSADFITDFAAKHWQDFDVSKGLENLRIVVSKLPPDTGIILSQRVGLTSHFADVLRRANVAAKMN